MTRDMVTSANKAIIYIFITAAVALLINLSVGQAANKTEIALLRQNQITISDVLIEARNDRKEIIQKLDLLQRCLMQHVNDAECSL